uniref:hypothetical protein n=1 Tax=Pseudomonas viridiflava TaxID=33069 RepID=UPI0019825E0B
MHTHAEHSSLYTSPEEAQNRAKNESDWLNAYPVGGGLPAMAPVQSLTGRFRKSIAGKPPPTV